jgi:hypothetical protein
VKRPHIHLFQHFEDVEAAALLRAVPIPSLNLVQSFAGGAADLVEEPKTAPAMFPFPRPRFCTG